jgi:hypothetical protein
VQVQSLPWLLGLVPLEQARHAAPLTFGLIVAEIVAGVPQPAEARFVAGEVS